MNKKLFIFDVDGVLLNVKRGCFKDLLVILGKGKEVREIDEEYQRRKHLGPWGLEQIAALYRGCSAAQLGNLAKKYCRKNLLVGAREAVFGLKKKKFFVVAISSGPQFVLEILKEMLGLDEVFGTKLGFNKKAMATGQIETKIDRYTKKEILRRIIQRNNFKKENVVAIGDPITDLPLSELAGIFIAFNVKDEEVKEKANVVIEKKDLKEVLRYVSND